MSIEQVLKNTEWHLASYKDSLEAMKAELTWLRALHERLITFQEGLTISVPHTEVGIVVKMRLGKGEACPFIYRTDVDSEGYENTRMLSIEDITSLESYIEILFSLYAALPDVCEKFREICSAKAQGLGELRTLVTKNVTNLSISR